MQAWLSAKENGTEESGLPLLYDVLTLSPAWGAAARSGRSSSQPASAVACVDSDNDGHLDVFALYGGEGAGAASAQQRSVPQ